MDEILRYLKKILVRTLFSPLKLCKVKKNRVLFIDALSKKYSGNPKYIAEYLMLHYPHVFEVFFAVDDPRKYSKYSIGNMRFIAYNSFSYFQAAMTAKIILTNSGGFSYIPLKKCQYVINTWHGGGAYKMAGIHMYNNSYFFRRDLGLWSKSISVFLSTNRRFSECLSDSMLIDQRKFWEIGMPRNDILLEKNDELRQVIRDRLGLHENEKLVLYAPTYRKVNDNYFRDSVAISYSLDESRLCSALEKRFGGNWTFAIRLHPSVTNREKIVPTSVRDLTDYSDMQELLLASDAMINDFSSSLWDYMLTGKPCFMYAEDLEHYIETTKVYTPIAEWPFPKSTTFEELIESIENFNYAEYSENCRIHYQALGGCETGEARKLTCERINEVCADKQIKSVKRSNQ